MTLANKTGNAGIASQLTIGHHWPGVRRGCNRCVPLAGSLSFCRSPALWNES